eukprot:5166801-Prymnesium_polylepis.2
MRTRYSAQRAQEAQNQQKRAPIRGGAPRAHHAPLPRPRAPPPPAPHLPATRPSPHLTTPCSPRALLCVG